MSPPTRRSEPHDRPASHQTPAKKSTRKVTRRWTDLAPNEPQAEPPGYFDALAAAIDAGELEEAGT